MLNEECRRPNGKPGVRIARVVGESRGELIPQTAVCRGTMKTFTDETSADPAVHCENLQQQMSELIDHLRRDVLRVKEPQFQALLETAAEVVGGLRTSLQHYSKHHEPAWKASAAR